MNPATPTFAVIGAVNHGKSSVVSTLAENDQVRVSAMPGETVENQRFELAGLFVFFDTPGFQNAREALAELRGAADAAQPLALFAAFIERHRGAPEFDAECRLFEPLVQGAGLVYVVDASRPLLDIHAAEMELMRLSGAPRLALINRSGEDQHLADWKRRLGQHFNAVREFDAHEAGFAQRVELLETLAGIDQGWKPRLMQAVQLLRDDRARRLDDAAHEITRLLADALQHRETADPPADAAQAEAAGQALKQRYLAALAAREARAHAALIRLFGHRYVKAGALPASLFGDDLFSEATWSLLGLDARQLLAAGAMAGAAVGAGLDLVTAGHTLLAGSALGAAAGAAGALVLGKRRPELGLGLPGAAGAPGLLGAWWPKRLKLPRLGGTALVVGPYAALNFPWVLIDRAVGTLAHVMHRAHARRDETLLTPEALAELLARTGLGSARWPDAERRRAEAVFNALRRGRQRPEDLAELQRLLRQQVERVAAPAPAAVPPAAPPDGAN